MSSCASTSLVEVAPPNAVADPSVVTSATGATQLYNMAIAQWGAIVAGAATLNGGQPYAFNLVAMTGRMTDELMRVQGCCGSFALIGDDERNDGSIANARLIENPMSFLLSPLYNGRLSAHQARDALELYAPAAPLAWRARMQAEEGYFDVYLAELGCNGTPLSIISLKTGLTLTSGLTTEEILDRSIVLFDSAMALAGDSTRFKYLAAVGKGRALLQAGKFADAAAAVSAVPTDFVYLVETNGGTTTPGANPIGNKPQDVQVRDNEGGNGLVWSTDPRAVVVTTPSLSGAMPVPGKYSVTAGVINAAVANPNAPVRASDGLEARLIEAEAALAAGDASWLTNLNALRGACIGTAACAPVPGLTAAVLPPLADPGTADARLNLLMKERAMWLYLTGHRQGDLRRLAHVYHRDPLTLWPVGTYVNPGFPPLIAAALDNGVVSYINQFVVIPTSTELTSNPLYTGCIDLNP